MLCKKEENYVAVVTCHNSDVSIGQHLTVLTKGLQLREDVNSGVRVTAPNVMLLPWMCGQTRFWINQSPSLISLPPPSDQPIPDLTGKRHSCSPLHFSCRDFSTLLVCK